MRLAIASVLLVFSAACATSAGSSERALSPESLSGCYITSSKEDGGRLLLTLNQDGSYEAFVIAGLGIWGKATGTWSLREDSLFFGPSNETKDWHHYMHAIGVERSGSNVTLIDGSESSLNPTPASVGSNNSFKPSPLRGLAQNPPFSGGPA